MLALNPLSSKVKVGRDDPTPGQIFGFRYIQSCSNTDRGTIQGRECQLPIVSRKRSTVQLVRRVYKYLEGTS